MKWALVGVIVLCNTAGDVLMTAGMKRWGELEHLRPSAIGRMLAGALRVPQVLGGIAALAVAFFTLLSLLSVANVSFAVPATGSSYLLETLLAKYVLKEQVSWRRWMGVALVVAGLVMISM